MGSTNHSMTFTLQTSLRPSTPTGATCQGLSSDKQLEFKTLGLSQNPTALLDPKYKYATAQPYASSSYGIMQLTPGAWKSSIGGILNGAFNIMNPGAECEKLGPNALLSVPTPDHYLPLLYVIATAQRREKVSFPVEGVDGGSISMLCVEVG